MSTQKKSRKIIIRAIGILIALIAISSLIYYGLEYQKYLTEQENNRQIVAVASRDGASAEQKQQAEGKDETENPDTFKNYQAKPDEPRAIYVDKLNIKARTLPMGVNPDGSMQAPINIFDAGWYTGAAKPGQKGVSVVVAHASGSTREGLFAYIDKLDVGDVVRIERGDGQIFEYKVNYKTTTPLDSINMTELLKPRAGEEGLNLMTCGGSWDAARKTYDQRIMIFTERIK